MNNFRALSRRDVTLGLLTTAGASFGASVGLADQQSSRPACVGEANNAPWTAFGINVVGPALAPERRGKYAKDYIYPKEDELSYYSSKGLKVVRVTFLWERLQPRLFSELNADELTRLRELAEIARRQGLILVTGPHNYARYALRDGDPQLIGSAAVPTAAFIDFWRRLSFEFTSVGDSLIFTLMNEPHDTGNSWSTTAQSAVDAIRGVDDRRWIYVPGDNWSSARSWRQYNENLAIADRSDRIVYDAHQYFDASGKGVYEQNYDADGAYPEIGVERVAPFLDWLREHRYRGTMTEYGVPNDDSRWLAVLDNTLNALKDSGVGGTYWAGGPWWGNYPLSSEPREGRDAPVMSVLTKYAAQCAGGQQN